MTEPPSGQPDDLEPPAADADHEGGDFAPGGYDDRQESGDSSLRESHERETTDSEPTQGSTDSP
jgi:hypothetical protein